MRAAAAVLLGALAAGCGKRAADAGGAPDPVPAAKADPAAPDPALPRLDADDACNHYLMNRGPHPLEGRRVVVRLPGRAHHAPDADGLPAVLCASDGGFVRPTVVLRLGPDSPPAGAAGVVAEAEMVGFRELGKEPWGRRWAELPDPVTRSWLPGWAVVFRGGRVVRAD